MRIKGKKRQVEEKKKKNQLGRKNIVNEKVLIKIKM